MAEELRGAEGGGEQRMDEEQQEEVEIEPEVHLNLVNMKFTVKHNF